MIARMAVEKPHKKEPGHYRSKETPHGWFVVLDYPLRLSKNGGALEMQSPWCVWHPESNAVVGFNTRKEATDALDALAAGTDVEGILVKVLAWFQASDSKQLQPVAISTEVQEDSSGSPAPAREDFSTGFMRAMQERFPASLLFDRLEDAMTACTVAKVEGAKYWRPDWGVRLKGLETAIAYLIGRPIERQQIMSSTAPASWEDILKLAGKSPVFRDTLMGMLREMESAPVREVEQA